MRKKNYMIKIRDGGFKDIGGKPVIGRNHVEWMGLRPFLAGWTDYDIGLP